MNDNNLFALFQSKNTRQNECQSGYEYKLGCKNPLTIVPSMESITDFYDGILSYVNDSNLKYYNDNNDDDVTINPANYSYPIFEKISSNITPIIVDINFTFLKGDNDDDVIISRQFNYNCIYYIQEIILGCFKVDESDDEKVKKTLLCFFLESDTWTNDDNQHKNLRFQFPAAVVNIEYLNRVIIPNFRKLLIEKNDLKKYISKTNVNTCSDIVPLASEYVSIYGSKNTENSLPMLLKGAYSWIEDIEHIDLQYEDQLMPFFYNFVDDDVINPDDNTLIINNTIEGDIIVDDPFYNLPLILSVHFCNKILKINDDINLSEVNVNEKKTVKKSFNAGAQLTKNPQEMLIELLPLINKSRFTEYYKYSWYTIGKAIYNITNGSQYGLNLIKQYTTDPVLNDLIDDIYDDYHGEIFNIITIKTFAHTDNKVMYDNLMKNYREHKLIPCLSKQSLDVGDLFSDILELDFVYDRTNEEWKYFDGTRLVPDKKAYGLINFIHRKGNKVNVVLEEFRQDMITKSGESCDRTQKQYYETILKQISDLFFKLSDLNYVKRIVEACQVYMYDDNLYVKTDENMMVMACKDSVFECYDDLIVNRPGMLQDYITKCTNCVFPVTYTMNHPKVRFMMKYYGQVHTDQQLCHFFLKTLASLLKGGNNEKFFINWIGEANASKSQVLKFVQAALGEYCVIIPNHLITVNINSNTGKPEPALERAKGAHAGFAAETDRSEKWHVGSIKKFTGNDVFFNRTLNKEGCERVLSWALIAMSNVVNDAPGADEAYFVREVIIPFLSKWVDDAPSSVEEQYKQKRFPIDLDFSNQIKKYGQAQLYLMYHYYPIYKREGIRMLPDVVKRVTFKHQKDLDVIFNFIYSKMLKCYVGDPKDNIADMTKKSTVSELHSIYKRWYRAAYGSDVIPLDQFKFRDEMDRRYSPSVKEIWYGIIPKPDEGSFQL